MIDCYKRHKIRHKSEYKARIHAKTMYKIKGVVLDVYLCYHCGGYHVGHAMNEMKSKELVKLYAE